MEFSHFRVFRGQIEIPKDIFILWLILNTIREAELHWYETHGIGKKEIKIKHLLD